MRGRKPAPRRSGIACKKKGFPRCPEDLSEAARVEWKRIGSLMGPQLINSLDVAVLRSYCEDVATFIKATAAIQTEGAVIKSPKGYPIENPWLWIQERAKKGIIKSSGVLGLTPIARSRMLPEEWLNDEEDSIEAIMSGRAVGIAKRDRTATMKIAE